jgi:magnesium transporter
MKAMNALSESFLESHPTEAALALEDVGQKPLGRFFARLDPGAAARVFEHLDPEVAAGCLGRMTPRAAASIVEKLSPHACVVTLRLMSEARRERVLATLDDQIAEQTRRMLRFEDVSVAALMDKDVLTLSEDMRTDEAIRRIRRSRLQFEGELYVLDRKHALVGVTTLHALLKAPPDQLVSESVNVDCARVLGSMAQRDLIVHPLWVEHNSAAVVDNDGVLLGVVDHRTVAKAAERIRSEVRNEGGLEAALALGELYWVGLTGMLDGLAGRSLATTRREEAEDGASSKS